MERRRDREEQYAEEVAELAASLGVARLYTVRELAAALAVSTETIRNYVRGYAYDRGAGFAPLFAEGEHYVRGPRRRGNNGPAYFFTPAAIERARAQWARPTRQARPAGRAK